MDTNKDSRSSSPLNQIFDFIMGHQYSSYLSPSTQQIPNLNEALAKASSEYLVQNSSNANYLDNQCNEQRSSPSKSNNVPSDFENNIQHNIIRFQNDSNDSEFRIISNQIPRFSNSLEEINSDGAMTGGGISFPNDSSPDSGEFGIISQKAHSSNMSLKNVDSINMSDEGILDQVEDDEIEVLEHLINQPMNSAIPIDPSNSGNDVSDRMGEIEFTCNDDSSDSDIIYVGEFPRASNSAPLIDPGMIKLENFYKNNKTISQPVNVNNTIEPNTEEKQEENCNIEDSLGKESQISDENIKAVIIESNTSDKEEKNCTNEDLPLEKLQISHESNETTTVEPNTEEKQEENCNNENSSDEVLQILDENIKTKIVEPNTGDQKEENCKIEHLPNEVLQISDQSNKAATVKLNTGEKEEENCEDEDLPDEVSQPSEKVLNFRNSISPPISHSTEILTLESMESNDQFNVDKSKSDSLGIAEIESVLENENDKLFVSKITENSSNSRFDESNEIIDKEPILTDDESDDSEIVFAGIFPSTTILRNRFNIIEDDIDSENEQPSLLDPAQIKIEQNWESKRTQISNEKSNEEDKENQKNQDLPDELSQISEKDFSSHLSPTTPEFRGIKNTSLESIESNIEFDDADILGNNSTELCKQDLLTSDFKHDVNKKIQTEPILSGDESSDSEVFCTGIFTPEKKISDEGNSEGQQLNLNMIKTEPIDDNVQTETIEGNEKTTTIEDNEKTETSGPETDKKDEEDEENQLEEMVRKLKRKLSRHRSSSCSKVKKSKKAKRENKKDDKKEKHKVMKKEKPRDKEKDHLIKKEKHKHKKIRRSKSRKSRKRSRSKDRSTISPSRSENSSQCSLRSSRRNHHSSKSRKHPLRRMSPSPQRRPRSPGHRSRSLRRRCHIPRRPHRSPGELSPSPLPRSRMSLRFSRSPVRQKVRRRSRSPKRLSRSPKRLSRSPKRLSHSPKRLSRSPSRLSRSPRRLSRSPKRWSRSPKHLSRSPKRLSCSPRRLSRSPRRLSCPPKRLSYSPRRSSRSPKRWSRSPKRMSRSPRRLSRSPRHLNRSPKRLNYSPRRSSRSPKRWSRSPKRMSRSPRRLSRSSRRLSRSPNRLSRSPKKFCRSPRRLSRSPKRFCRSPKRSRRQSSLSSEQPSNDSEQWSGTPQRSERSPSNSNIDYDLFSIDMPKKTFSPYISKICRDQVKVFPTIEKIREIYFNKKPTVCREENPINVEEELIKLGRKKEKVNVQDEVEILRKEKELLIEYLRKSEKDREKMRRQLKSQQASSSKIIEQANDLLLPKFKPDYEIDEKEYYSSPERTEETPIRLSVKIKKETKKPTQPMPELLQDVTKLPPLIDRRVIEKSLFPNVRRDPRLKNKSIPLQKNEKRSALQHQKSIFTNYERVDMEIDSPERTNNSSIHLERKRKQMVPMPELLTDPTKLLPLTPYSIFSNRVTKKIPLPHDDQQLHTPLVPNEVISNAEKYIPPVLNEMATNVVQDILPVPNESTTHILQDIPPIPDVLTSHVEQEIPPIPNEVTDNLDEDIGENETLIVDSSQRNDYSREEEIPQEKEPPKMSVTMIRKIKQEFEALPPELIDLQDDGVIDIWDPRYPCGKPPDSPENLEDSNHLEGEKEVEAEPTFSFTVFDD